MERRFDGGSMTSGCGVLPLGEVDRKLGLIEAAPRCIADPRSLLLIKHAVRDMRHCSSKTVACSALP